jgi:hypothetical protein
MAKIPTYQQTFLPDTNVSQAGEIEGRAVAEVGKAITGLGFQLKQAQAAQEAKQKELQRQKDNSLISAAAMELQKKEFAIRNDLEKSELDPLSMPDEFNKSYETEVRNITKRMEKAGLSTNGFQALKLKSEQIKLSGYKNTVGMSDKMFAKEVANNYEGIKEDLGVLAYRGRDLVDGMNDVDEFLEANAAAFPDNVKEDMRREGYNSVYYNFGVGQIDRNPFTGKKILDSGVLDDNLTGEQLHRLNSRADAEIASIMRQRKQDKIKEELEFNPLRTVDRENRDEVKAYNEWVESLNLLPSIKSDNPQDRQMGYWRLKEIVSKHKLMPENIESYLRSGIYGEDPIAEELLVNLKQDPEIRGLVFSKLNEKDIGLAETKKDLRENGFTQEQINEYIDRNIFPKNPQRIEEIKNEINEIEKDVDYETLARETIVQISQESEVDRGWFPGVPGVAFEEDIDLKSGLQVADDIRTPENFMIDYKLKLKKYLKATGGDLERAKKLTNENLASTYGMTRFNGGNVLMEHAPETTAFVQDPALSEIEEDWMQKQLQQNLLDLRRNDLLDPEVEYDVEENIILVTDNMTREGIKQNKPSWLVLQVKEEDGEEYLDTILNENAERVRYTPNALEYRQMLSEERRKEIEEKYKEAKIKEEERRKSRIKYQELFSWMR